MGKQEIYLDNSQLARPSERALSAMMPFYTDHWGSIGSPHQKGQELFPFLETAYREIYALFGGTARDTFILTSSAAESINHVIQSAYYDISLTTGKNHFITSSIEDAPIMMAIGRLEKIQCVGKMVKADRNGLVSAEAIGDALTPRTALVSLSWAHGLTGQVQPITEISELCKERGVLFHLDVTHALGKIYFEFEDLGADILTFHGAPLHAPKGTGGIYLKEGIRLSPFILGGNEQAGLRAGEFDIPGLMALSEASKELLESRDYMCTEVARLRDKFESQITGLVPGARVAFQDQERLPHCSTILFPGIANEAMLWSLNRQKVYASIGGGHFQQLGLMLHSCGIETAEANTAVSFSLSRETMEEEIDRAAEIVVKTARKLRTLSEKI